MYIVTGDKGSAGTITNASSYAGVPGSQQHFWKLSFELNLFNWFFLRGQDLVIQPEIATTELPSVGGRSEVQSVEEAKTP